MRTAMLAAVAITALSSVGCGATTRSTATGSTPAVTTVTTASVTFMSRDDGKDEDSAIAVQLLDEGGRLTAEGTVVDVDFDERTVSQPLALSMSRALTGGDLDDARLRLRLTPDGRDTWTFDLRANVRLSDGTERQYFWSGLRLDESSPERVLTLASGRTQM
jgi:hypothetical protein